MKKKLNLADKEYKKLKRIAKEMTHYFRVLNKKETKEYELGFAYFKKYFFSLND